MIDECDVVVHPQRVHLRYQALAIVLALCSQQVGMRLTRDEVEGVRMPRNDTGHRLDHVLEPLARVDQAKGRDDRPPFDAELLLETLAAVRLDGRHSVGDDPRHSGGAVLRGEDVDRRRGHHDDLAAEFADGAHRLPHRR